MGQLEWGFKSYANKIARETREELGLSSAAPLNPWALADFLGIPVIPLSVLKDEAPEAVRQLRVRDRGAFSAVTVFNGFRRMIVVNDAHSRGRQASNVAHELAHSLLQHRPAPAFDGEEGRRWDAAQEAEAEWLAGALLISDEAAVSIVREGLPQVQAARLYGVSIDMVRFRLNVTGARTRVERARRRRRRPS